ncbi:MAG: hypothetical protein JRI36_03625 [Deltaproteobacteria bacterium]|nr:hypothetical protein [Deltaproteobacteria bacterium]
MIHLSYDMSIRQDQAGRFRRPEDGRQPYAHVRQNRLESTREQKRRSIYVGRQQAVTIKKEPSKSDFPKMFDPDVGTRFVMDDRMPAIRPKQVHEDQPGPAPAIEKKTLSTPKTSLVDDWA